MSQTPLPPAGWYPDQERPGQERWWNGSSWSETFRPAPGTPTPPTTTVPYGAPQPGQGVHQPPGTQPAYGGYQPAYQPGYQPSAPSGSHLVRNLLIGLGLVVLLLVGGCTALVVVVGHKVDTVVNDDTPGGPNNPLTITPGEGFEVAGFEYADGWAIGPDAVGDVTVTDLKVTNHRDKSDWAFVTVKLLSGNEVVASVECTSPGSRIDEDTTIKLDCSSSDDLPSAYDEVTIQDAF